MKTWLVFFVVFLATYATLTAVYGAEPKKPQEVASDCRALRELNREHKGRTLSDEERVVKAQLVTWYKQNCNKKGQK